LAGSWIAFCALRKIVPKMRNGATAYRGSRVAPRQLFALQIPQHRPAAFFRDCRAVLDADSGQPHPLVVHLEEQKIEICKM
jgi:hypothetical protein